MPGEKEMPEAESKKQRRFMGMVHACQKYGKCPSAEVRKVAGTIKPDDALSFARTKEHGLPEKAQESSARKSGKHASTKHGRKSFREYLDERGYFDE